MKHSIKSLIGYTMQAMDGEIGKVEEFYFDDKSWTIRYLVVKTGGWLLDRKVLISPQALLMPAWDNQSFPVTLTKEQVRNSPDIDTDKPVSRQQEEQLSKHYPWQGYWNSGFYAGGIWGIMPAAPIPEDEVPVAENDGRPGGDVHLRSTHNVTGYTIHATDGEIGEVTDYIIDDTDWKIGFLVIKTGHWFGSRHLLLSTKWIREVRWADSNIVVNITTNNVKSGPAYDEAQYIDDVYSKKLFDHYGKLLDEHQKQLA